MFGLGPTELAVILVLALLVMGPKRIPELATNLGKAIRGFRRATRELREQIDIDDEVRRPFEDLRSALRDEPPPPPRYDLLRPAEAPEPATAPPSPYDPAASAALGAFSQEVFSESIPAAHDAAAPTAPHDDAATAPIHEPPGAAEPPAPPAASAAGKPEGPAR